MHLYMYVCTCCVHANMNVRTLQSTAPTKVYLLQKMIPMMTAAMTAAVIRTRRTITTATMAPVDDAAKGVIKQRETHICIRDT